MDAVDGQRPRLRGEQALIDRMQRIQQQKLAAEATAAAPPQTSARTTTAQQLLSKARKRQCTVARCAAAGSLPFAPAKNHMHWKARQAWLDELLNDLNSKKAEVQAAIPQLVEAGEGLQQNGTATLLIEMRKSARTKQAALAANLPADPEDSDAEM